MKFPKLNMKGLIKAPKNMLKEPDFSGEPTPVKPIASEVTKFNGLKRKLAKEKNITKKYKI